MISKKIKFKKVLLLTIVILQCFISYATSSYNDGSFFITRTEFDALMNSFKSQIDAFNMNIDAKVEEGIATYLGSILSVTEYDDSSLFPNAHIKSYGSSNELHFKASQPTVKGFYTESNASAGPYTNSLYSSTYCYINFNHVGNHGVNKVVEKVLSDRSVTAAAKWLGYTTDMDVSINYKTLSYDKNGNSKRWSPAKLEYMYTLMVYPSLQYFSFSSSTTENLDQNLLYGIAISGNTTSPYNYNCSPGLKKWAMYMCNPNRSAGSRVTTWGQLSYIQFDSSYSSTLPNVDYGTMKDPNIILTTPMSEDVYFNNTLDIYSYSNYNEFINIPEKTAEYTYDSVVQPLIDKNYLLPIENETYYENTYASLVADMRPPGELGGTVPSEGGLYMTEEHYPPSPSGVDTDFDKRKPWGTDDDYYHRFYKYYFWPQKGWDPTVKYSSLYCPNLQSPELNSIYQPLYPSAFVTDAADSQYKLKAYAGVPIYNGKKDMQIEFQFEFTDDDEYDVWLKTAPFTNEENPTQETGVWEGLSEIPYTPNADTNAIKVKTGDYIKMKFDNNSYLFIKWSKHGNNGTGGGEFISPRVVHVTIKE